MTSTRKLRENNLRTETQFDSYLQTAETLAEMALGKHALLSIVAAFGLAALSSCAKTPSGDNAPAPAPKQLASETPPAKTSSEGIASTAELEKSCLADMKKFRGRDDKQLDSICKEVHQLSGCTSVQGKPIYHYNRSSENAAGKRILAFALIHGDEGPSGTVARTWMERLSKIDPQNHWRIVPVLNPDGWEKNTRMNSRGIDINRNFPTANWAEESQKRWIVSEDKDPRRFPGTNAASEPETLCAMSHIDDFKPSFIISVHTPFGVLDYDGPRIKFPEYSDLPWFSLGNFPGSMGRYMWVERRVPVLTIELKGNDVAEKLDKFDKLQDVTGVVAIQAEKNLREKNEKAGSKKKSKSDPDEISLNSYSESRGGRPFKNMRLK